MLNYVIISTPRQCHIPNYDTLGEMEYLFICEHRPRSGILIIKPPQSAPLCVLSFSLPHTLNTLKTTKKAKLLNLSKMIHFGEILEWTLGKQQEPAEFRSNIWTFSVKNCHIFLDFWKSQKKSTKKPELLEKWFFWISWRMSEIYLFFIKPGQER